MKQQHQRQRLVLLGGGHAHALVLLEFIHSKPADTEIILISPNTLTPYSGMLPGLIAGHYCYQDIHIDLATLCRRANIHFIEQRAISLDADQQMITLENQNTITYDILSIDIGITPDTRGITGAEKYSLSVKPIADFYEKLNALYLQISESHQPFTIAVIGGGAGSIEVIFALAYALRRKFSNKKLCFKLITRNEDILSNHPKTIRAWLKKLLIEDHIELITQCHIYEVRHNILLGHATQSAQMNIDHTIDCNYSIFCTSANAPKFFSNCGLALTNGFISTDKYLRSLSHHNVFAAGDCIHFNPHPLPKAGVFAVRQASILQKNLYKTCNKQSLIPYKPQRSFLTLLALGKKYAIGSRGQWLCLKGQWVWQWKNYIDKKFIRHFN